MGLDSHLIVTKTRVIANYDVFDSRGVSCNTENHTLNVPDDIWVGPFLNGNTTMIVVHPCLFQYCETGERTITISDGFDSTSDLDEQCSSEQHRGGFLCGDCIEGYSNIFGSTKCLQCSNNWALLIVLFLLAAVFLISQCSLSDIWILVSLEATSMA